MTAGPAPTAVVPHPAPPQEGRGLGPAGGPELPVLERRQVVVLLAAGLVGAAVLPGHEPGLAVTVTWLSVVVAVLATRPRHSWAGAWRRTMACVAAVAGLLPAVSDAGWVVVPALFAGVAAAVLAVAGGGSWLGLVRAGLRSLPVGFGSFGAVAVPMRALFPDRARRHPALRAAALTVVLLAGFGALFASADRVFGTFVQRFLVPDVDLELLPARVAVAVLVTVGAATLVRLRARGRDDRPLPAPSRQLQAVEWWLPLGALTGLFAVFVALQFGVLFGGHDRVLRTAGLTYAEYARGGFGQLLMVAALTLALVGATRRYAASPTTRDERRQRRLLAALCLLTLVVLASAFHRLSIYQDAYGFTRSRFAAQFAIWWLAAIFVLLLLAGARRRAHLLPRAVALLSAAAVVGVAFVQPDARIAAWNVDRFAVDGRVDATYLATLSADAVPALLRLPEEVRGCALGLLVDDLANAEEAGLLEWQWSRSRAARLLAGAMPLPDCTDVDRWG